MQNKNVFPVPAVFEQYAGYNEVKRKKLKSQPLSSNELNIHGETLYGLLLKPYINSSPSWKSAAESIKQLADCLIAYKKHLVQKAEEVNFNRSQDHPVRTVDTHSTVEHRNSTPFLPKQKYLLLEADVKAAGLYNPVVYDESKHLEKPFENNTQRFRFLAELQLSVPVDIIRFCPGGSVFTTVCITEVPDCRSEDEMLTQSARMVQKMKPQLKEYHTRAQKRAFKEKLKNVAAVSPSVVNLLFSELTLDASTASHPDMQQRLRLIFLGEHGLLADLRHLNPGRPSNRYDIFFETLEGLVEEVAAADDRRHASAHLTQWISLSDMIQQAADRCPEGTPIPSKSLVRLQFAPSNPYTRTALNFTSRIPVQYKIQKRQLRVKHPDDHYCAALLKYLKHKAVEMKDYAATFFCDDKAKVKVGEPGRPVSTGVRGKSTIAPKSTELVALDHDMASSSLTPSVVLECSVPESVAEKSFVRGKVVTVINDSVFQPASPFRHAVILKKIIEQHEVLPKAVLKYTDGGTDQRNTLEAVKCANICLFAELNLDMLITARCAPGQSYTNPAERIMSILNLGLQNCATERKQLDEETEAEFKKCKSMAKLRSLAAKKPEIKEKWTETVEPVQSLVRNRFLRLSLKGEPVSALDPASDEEIHVLKRHLGELFPQLDTANLRKAHTKKIQVYNEWKKKHCLETMYSFQIRKCADVNCCLPPSLPREKLTWLPDPMLDESGEHFKSYDVVKNESTSEKDRPSLKLKKPKKLTKRNAAQIKEHSGACSTSDPSTSEEVEDGPISSIEDTSLALGITCSTQNARSTVSCIECTKPRVIYSKHKLTQRQELSLAIAVSAYEYTCGSFLLPPSSPLQSYITLRPQLQCSLPIEIPYFGASLGRKDLCAHCGDPDGVTDAELKKSYKTVLPICPECRNKGIKPIVQRPFGKRKM